MKKYIGITIGPIFDTMNVSSSPLAIWASSFMFSTLSKTLCTLLVENGLKEDAIVSPYYAKNDPLLNENDGVGLFHDRIIFDASDFDIRKLEDIKKEAISTIAKLLGISDRYLTEYLMISYAPFEAENPIEASKDILNCLELAKSYVHKDGTSELLRLFSGNSHSKNSELEKTHLVKSVEDFQLKKPDGTYKSIEEIVSTGSDFKKYDYYAIVRSDGDNMGDIIESLENDEDIRKFSRICLQYCSDIAKKVKNYGGITIYSGGDDLLAILPCESRDGKTPFEFASEAASCFDKAFKKYNKPVSLSFGITVAYHRFPLFEALQDSYYLLAEIAKKEKTHIVVPDKKNRVAIRFQKHAGQSEGLIISNDFIDCFTELLNYVKEENNKSNATKDIILSIMHKFTLFESIFNNLDDETQIDNAVKNIFDAEIHKKSSFITQKIPGFIKALKQNTMVATLSEKETKTDDLAKTLNYCLRICKFFIEKEGD